MAGRGECGRLRELEEKKQMERQQEAEASSSSGRPWSEEAVLMVLPLPVCFDCKIDHKFVLV
jgi:hypothetical protein